PLAAQTRARQHTAAGDAGAHVRGWRARRPRGARGACARRSSRARARRRQRRLLAAGHALTADDPRMADEAVDAWLKPYERPSDRAAAMREYLSWEVDLPARIARDGSANFTQFQP